MQLLYSIDPRDPLEKANRDEMYQYAERNGIKEIEWWMAGNQMRVILRKNGVKDIGLPDHILGLPRATAKASAPVHATSLDELERVQWEAQARDTRREPVQIIDSPSSPMTRAQMAKECKRLGIKMARTDTKEKLVERLSGKQNAA